MPAITREDVAHLASLARLALTEDELDHYAEQLDVILGGGRVGRRGRRRRHPADHARRAGGERRSATTSSPSSLDREAVLDSAPAAEDGRFRVPRILDEE